MVIIPNSIKPNPITVGRIPCVPNTQYIENHFSESLCYTGIRLNGIRHSGMNGNFKAKGIRCHGKESTTSTQTSNASKQTLKRREKRKKRKLFQVPVEVEFEVEVWHPNTHSNAKRSEENASCSMFLLK